MSFAPEGFLLPDATFILDCIRYLSKMQFCTVAMVLNCAYGVDFSDVNSTARNQIAVAIAPQCNVKFKLVLKSRLSDLSNALKPSNIRSILIDVANDFSSFHKYKLYGSRYFHFIHVVLIFSALHCFD